MESVKEKVLNIIKLHQESYSKGCAEMSNILKEVKERERILERLGRIYCINPHTQKQLDADLMTTIAAVIIDEKSKSWNEGYGEGYKDARE